MIKILAVSLLIVSILGFSTNHLQEQDSWNWVSVNDLSNEQKSVEQWVRGQIPALGGYTLSKAARLGDQLQFHYDGPSSSQGWDVITNGGKGDGKFIQRATYLTTEQGADGSQIIKKKHIVRNDFIKSINDFS